MKAGSAGVPPAQHWHSLTPLLHPARPATAPRFRFSRAHGVPGGRVAVCRIMGKLSGHPTQRMRARRPRSRRGASSHPSCSARRHCSCRCGSAVPLRLPSCVFVDSSFFRLPPPCWADHTRVKHSIVNQGEPRMHTNGHEYPWTRLAATPSRDEGRERGRPARTTLAQPHPSLPPGSTGNGATIPLQPSPWGSRRQGGQAPHHGETERPPNPEDAGETPALPVGRLLPSFLLRQEAQPLPMRQCRSAWWPFVDSSFFRQGRALGWLQGAGWRWICFINSAALASSRSLSLPYCSRARALSPTARWASPR